MWFTTKMVEEAKKSFAEAVAREAAAEASAEEATPQTESTANAESESASVGEEKSQASSAETKEDNQVSQKPTEPDWKTLYALTLADFDNYKKRAARDREETYRYAEADILKDILPAVDNLQLALGAAKDKGEDPFVKGVQLVLETILKSLKDHGAEPFDSLGLPLDTEKMEAIASLPSPDVEEGKVSIESKKGWMLKGKVLRAAQVVVSSGKGE